MLLFKYNDTILHDFSSVLRRDIFTANNIMVEFESFLRLNGGVDISSFGNQYLRAVVQYVLRTNGYLKSRLVSMLAKLAGASYYNTVVLGVSISSFDDSIVVWDPVGALIFLDLARLASSEMDDPNKLDALTQMINISGETHQDKIHYYPESPFFMGIVEEVRSGDKGGDSIGPYQFQIGTLSDYSIGSGGVRKFSDALIRSTPLIVHSLALQQMLLQKEVKMDQKRTTFRKRSMGRVLPDSVLESVPISGSRISKWLITEPQLLVRDLSLNTHVKQFKGTISKRMLSAVSAANKYLSPKITADVLDKVLFYGFSSIDPSYPKFPYFASLDKFSESETKEQLQIDLSFDDSASVGTLVSSLIYYYNRSTNFLQKVLPIGALSDNPSKTGLSNVNLKDMNSKILDSVFSVPMSMNVSLNRFDSTSDSRVSQIQKLTNNEPLYLFTPLQEDPRFVRSSELSGEFAGLFALNTLNRNISNPVDVASDELGLILHIESPFFSRDLR